MKKAKLLPLLSVLSTAVLAQAADEKPMLGQHGIETKHISKTIKPGDNFYRYVNEGWLSTSKLPKGFPVNNSFVDAFLRTEKQLKSVIDSLLQDEAQLSKPEEQLKGLYQSYMNTVQIEQLGLKPLQTEIENLNQIKNHQQVAEWMGNPLHQSIINLVVRLNPSDTNQYVATLIQSGLGLDRDYYLADSERFVDHRKAYQAYIEKMLTKANYPGDAKKQAQAILTFETKLAKIHWPPTEKRDKLKNHHLMTQAELAKYAPEFDWNAYFNAIGLSTQKQFDINTDTAIQNSAKLFKTAPSYSMRLISTHSRLIFSFI